MTTLTKEEVQDIRILMWHAEEDISFGGGGTYAHPSMVTDNKGNYKIDTKAVKSAKSAIKNLSKLIGLIEKYRDDNN